MAGVLAALQQTGTVAAKATTDGQQNCNRIVHTKVVLPSRQVGGDGVAAGEPKDLRRLTNVVLHRSGPGPPRNHLLMLKDSTIHFNFVTALLSYPSS